MEYTAKINNRYEIKVTYSHYRKSLNVYAMKAEYKNFHITLQYDVANDKWIVDIKNAVMNEITMLRKEGSFAFVRVSDFIGTAEGSMQLSNELKDASELSGFMEDLVSFAEQEYKKTAV